MICPDAQVRQMVKERKEGSTQQQAALKVNAHRARTPPYAIVISRWFRQAC